ncbi:MAG: cbb3-type cytochrome oxidase assembly protein CcoS [Porticoccaceae bacterium]
MESLYFLIPLSIVVLGLAVLVFFWAVNNGQYDDLEGEAERILFDEIDEGEAPITDTPSLLKEGGLKQDENRLPETDNQGGTDGSEL